MKWVRSLVKWIVVGLLALTFLLAASLALARMRPFEKMPAVWGRKPLVVLGGSMEPAIKVGSVVVVGPVNPAQVKVGDIITFKTPVKPSETLRGERVLTTHRVVEVLNEEGRLSFKTKGDANEDPDGWTVSERDVLGRVNFSVPYLGYLAHFVRRPAGFVLLVILPGLLIIATEVRNILVQMKLAKSQKTG